MKFVDNPDPNNEFEMKIDEKLKEKIPQWAPTFASYLIHIYNKYYNVKNRIPEPEEVLISTNKYRKAQDLIREYYESKLMVTTDSKDTLMKKELQTDFRAWVKSQHEGENIPKSQKLYDFIENEIKQEYNKKYGWKCIAFRDDSAPTAGDVDVDV